MNVLASPADPRVGSMTTISSYTIDTVVAGNCLSSPSDDIKTVLELRDLKVQTATGFEAKRT